MKFNLNYDFLKKQKFTMLRIRKSNPYLRQQFKKNKGE